jgi:RNA polymerase sigma factor, sigma-70 family
MNTIPQAQFAGPQTLLSRFPRSGWTPEREAHPAERPGETLQIYLREIGQVKLLTPEEEVALAQRVRLGDKEAREHMIKANLRLVVKIARDYEGFGLPLLDLISEGNIGLMKGVERFDPTKGARLSTYAAWWIKEAIKGALTNQSKTIRLPVYVSHHLAHIRRAELKLHETLEREATDEELAHQLDLTPRRVRQYRQAAHAPVCLDSPVGNEDPTPISEMVADENTVAPDDELERENDNDLVHEVLDSLNPRESKILAMRFGLDDGTSKTLDQVAESFSITRERVRQIQEHALEKMRARIERRDTFRIPLSLLQRPRAIKHAA